MCTLIQDSSRRLHYDRGNTTPTPYLWRVPCVQSSSTSADGYFLTEVTLHLHLLHNMCHVYNHPVHQQTLTFWQRLHYTYIFSMTRALCTIIRAVVHGYILTEVTLHLPSQWRVSCIHSFSTVVDGYILTEVTLHLSMTCDMCTIIRDSSRRLHSDRGYTTPTL